MDSVTVWQKEVRMAETMALELVQRKANHLELVWAWMMASKMDSMTVWLKEAVMVDTMALEMVRRKVYHLELVWV